MDLSNLDQEVTSLDIQTIKDQHFSLIQSHASLSSFKSNSMGLIANGWVLGPFDNTETFIDNDFSLLESFIQKIGLTQIKDLVINKWSTKDTAQDLIVKISCILGKHVSSTSSNSNEEMLVSSSKRHRLPTPGDTSI